VKIKEQDSQYLVIASTFGERLFGVFFAVIGIIFLAVFFSSILPNASMGLGEVLFAAVPLVFVYIGVRRLMGKRIVCDKSIGGVILEAPDFVLIRKKRIIPFTDVKRVDITYKRISSGQSGSRDGWQVSLDTGGEMVKIDHTTKEQNMLHLAYTISRFIGKELVEDSAKTGTWFTRLFR
jgi:hypothetical protein